MSYTPSARAQSVVLSGGNNQASLVPPVTGLQSAIIDGYLAPAALFDGLQTSNYYTEINSAGAPVFTNLWVNYGSGTNSAAFCKDACGVVHLKGTIKTGTVGDAAFTLPDGYLPPGESIFIVISNSTVGRVDVTTGGAVTPISPSNNTYVSLDGISFLATA